MAMASCRSTRAPVLFMKPKTCAARSPVSHIAIPMAWLNCAGAYPPPETLGSVQVSQSGMMSAAEPS